MTKSKAVILSAFAAVITVFSLVVFFCTFDFGSGITGGGLPYEKELNGDEIYVIYIGGAVEHPGFYEYTAGETVFEVISRARLHPKAYVPEYSFRNVANGSDVFIVDFLENGAVTSCANLAVIKLSAEIFVRAAVNAGIMQETAEKIAEYCLNHDVDNVSQLQSLLGEEYNSVYYRLYCYI